MVLIGNHIVKRLMVTGARGGKVLEQQATGILRAASRNRIHVAILHGNVLSPMLLECFQGGLPTICSDLSF